MKPNLHEWRDQERGRVTREGTGARYIGYVYARHLKRCGGMMLATIPIILLIQALPQTPDGPVQPCAALIAGVILAALSITAWRWLKPVAPMSKWAIWTSFAFGCAMIMIGLLT